MSEQLIISDADISFPAISRESLTCLQVNLGYLCNLSCVHCHVNAGPHRTEMMDRQTVDQVLEVLKQHSVQLLDLTGGAPELNPHFRYLVEQATEIGVAVVDRCNLTVLFESGQEDLAEFLAQHKVSITASLPCYLEENVSAQRGKGVFQQSIEALRLLNTLGYGDRFELNLVYNPQGAVLPPPQALLQQDYKRVLADDYGVHFNNLFTLTNVPIQRFRKVLQAHDNYNNYIKLLVDNYSEDNLQTVMCRSLLSVDWQGYLYDCDFNQMLDMPASIAGKRRSHLKHLLGNKQMASDVKASIAVGEHCFACTAGQGSSCSGALSQ